MAYVKKTFSKKPKSATKRIYKKRVYKKRTSTISNVKNIVRREIQKNIENKTSIDDPLAYTFNVSNSTCSPAVSLINPLKNIVQGLTDGCRIGNKINVKKCIMNMNFTCTGISDTATGPYYVMFYIGTLKNDPATAPSATDLTKLLNDGSTSTGLTNSTLTMLRNVNRDYFTISYMKKFKLGCSSTVGSAVSFPNNDFPINRQFKFNLKKLCGQVVYNDSASTINKMLFMWCHYIALNSSTSSTTAPILLDYYIDVNYEDA